MDNIFLTDVDVLHLIAKKLKAELPTNHFYSETVKPVATGSDNEEVLITGNGEIIKLFDEFLMHSGIIATKDVHSLRITLPRK